MSLTSKNLKFLFVLIAVFSFACGQNSAEENLVDSVDENQVSAAFEEPSPQPTYDTSDGRLLAKGNIDINIDILTVPKTEFIEQIVETRTDVHGTYAVTKMSYPSVDGVKNLSGVSPKQLASALEFYTDFISTQYLDSIALDDYNRYQEWVEKVAPKYLAQDNINEIVNAQKNGSFGEVIFNNYDDSRETDGKNLIPVLMRDGKPRVFNKHMWDLRAEYSNGGIRIWSQGAATVITDDKKAMEWDILMWGEFADQVREQISQDAKYSNSIHHMQQIYYQTAITLKEEDDNWTIIGFDSSTYTRGLLSELTERPEVLEWREAIR